jgi:hypothetical protein
MITNGEDGLEDVGSYHGQEAGDPKGTEVFNTRSHIYRDRLRELSNMKLECRPLKLVMQFVLRVLNCFVELVHVHEVDFEDENCTAETIYKYSLGHRKNGAKIHLFL